MRSFTIVKINSSDRRVKSNSIGGRFQSTDPASAAKKAGSSICRLNNINSTIKFKIAIRETTQGSAHKIFVYSFKRVRNPRTVMRSGKQITYEFETKVKSIKRSSRDGAGNKQLSAEIMIATDMMDSEEEDDDAEDDFEEESESDSKDVINPINKIPERSKRSEIKRLERVERSKRSEIKRLERAERSKRINTKRINIQKQIGELISSTEYKQPSDVKENILLLIELKNELSKFQMEKYYPQDTIDKLKNATAFIINDLQDKFQENEKESLKQDYETRKKELMRKTQDILKKISSIDLQKASNEILEESLKLSERQKNEEKDEESDSDDFQEDTTNNRNANFEKGDGRKKSGKRRSKRTKKVSKSKGSKRTKRVSRSKRTKRNS